MRVSKWAEELLNQVNHATSVLLSTTPVLQHARLLATSHPLLMAVTYASVSPASMGPLRIWLPSRLGSALLKISCVKRCRPSLRG